jgi:predicted metalloprotease with PDZ domain
VSLSGCRVVGVWLTVLFSAYVLAAGPTVTVAVDATEAPRKIFHAHLTIPTKPGTLTLCYPKWIPGEHGPTGPIQDLAGLKFTGNGQSWRRPLDYYEEDVLNWLWVDVMIRQQSHGRKSIDDFCHLFHGGQSRAPEVKSYTFDDVVNTLNQVVPYDWRGFWTERLKNQGPGAPLGGLEGSGWKLVYDDMPSELVKASEDDENRKMVNAMYSIGLWLKPDGEIVDTIKGMPAAQAGIGPGMKLVAVNEKQFSADVLRDPLQAGKNGSGTLDLLVENTDYYRTYKLDYHQGEKYPHLVRDESKPDLLSEIITPK